MVFGLFGSEKKQFKKEQEEKNKEAELYKNARRLAENHVNEVIKAGEIEIEGTIYKTTKAFPVIKYKGRNEETGDHSFEIQIEINSNDNEGKMSISEILENSLMQVSDLEWNDDYKTQTASVNIVKYYPEFENNLTEDEAHMVLANSLEKIEKTPDGKRMVLLHYEGIGNHDSNIETYDFIIGLGKWGEIEKRSRNISSEVRKAVYERDGGCCVQCGSNNDIEYDHKLPFSKGGSNSVNNIQILCFKCNRAKGAKL